MNSFKIANAINSIGDDLILEADETSKTVSKKPIRLKYAAVAAALVCVIGGVNIAVKTQKEKEMLSHGIVPPFIDSAPISGIPVIKMSDIRFNDPLLGIVSSDSLVAAWDSPMYDSIVLDTAGIIEYYGWDLIPKYIPDGLIPSEQNNSTKIYSRKDTGRIANDRKVIQFFDGYDEEGFPKGTASAGYEAPKGFELIAAKYGSLDLCCRLNISNIADTSSIGGTNVYFAHLSVPIGKVSDPSGYWDNYIAEFELNGIQYRVTTKQLKAEEIVKIVSSIICGEDFTVEE